MKLQPICFGDRFLGRYTVDDFGCWNWTGAKMTRGYGVMSAYGKQMGAHRVSYWIKHGTPPPPWISVCHSCDNVVCVNPDHLWGGTQQENARDAQAKGRIKSGRKQRIKKGRRIHCWPEELLSKMGKVSDLEMAVMACVGHTTAYRKRISMGVKMLVDNRRKKD